MDPKSAIHFWVRCSGPWKTRCLRTGRSSSARASSRNIWTLRLANRHGLVTGATGTGKTVTLQVLAEGFSDAGVPVFAADVKGDLSGIAAPGDAEGRRWSSAPRRSGSTTTSSRRFPVVFWDLFGEQGHPIRATVSEMGPLLLARLLELNETQEGVLNIAFQVADDEGLLLLDLKDLRALLQLRRRAAPSELTHDVRQRRDGHRSAPSSAGCWCWSSRAATSFFGEPALDITDLMRTDARRPRRRQHPGRRQADDRRRGSTRPSCCGCCRELFEELPEVGDPDKPKLVFFFDEAHLLFDDAPKALLDKVEQVVRLIRSKGVGVYFVTQNPLDVPDTVLGPARQPRPARAARLHAARAEGACARRPRPSAPTPSFDIGARSPSWRSARRWSRCCEARACPRWSAHADPPAVGARRAGRRRRSARR